MDPAAVLPTTRVLGPADASAESLRQVLDVGWKEKTASLEDQDPQVGAGTVPVEFLGTVATEHPGADDHGVEWKAAVLGLGLDL